MYRLLIGLILFLFFAQRADAQIYPVPRTTPPIADTSLFMSDIPKAFSEVPYFTFGQGIGIQPSDSSYSFNLRFRMQNRAGFTFEEGEATDIEARVRRLRLRFDGFVLNPRISYVIQLSFTRGDMDWENTQFPNVVRDAMVFYRLSEKIQLGFGQTKLPGNRQRVNSSGDLQLVDRSIVNATFNVDRDFGIQAAYTENPFGNTYVVFRGAVTSGEGRNILTTSIGLAYTGRMEVLPFGLFERFGDYFEGDLLREKRPKLSAGFTYSYNEQTLRTGGQIGSLLFEPRDMTTIASDWLFKYNGWAAAAEWMYRISDDPITTNELGDIRFIYTGFGQNYQLSYIFPSNYELVGRYSRLVPESSIRELTPDLEQYTLGVTKYLNGHRLKVQSDITYEQRRGVAPGESLMLRFQVELGI